MRLRDREKEREREEKEEKKGEKEEGEGNRKSEKSNNAVLGTYLFVDLKVESSAAGVGHGSGTP